MSPPLASPRLGRRWPFVLLLLASLAFLGLVAGTAAAGAWFVPEGSGLVGPAIALGYGVLGAAGTLVLGGLLAWKGSHRLLRAAAVAAAGLALLVVLAVVLGVARGG